MCEWLSPMPSPFTRRIEVLSKAQVSAGRGAFLLRNLSSIDRQVACRLNRSPRPTGGAASFRKEAGRSSLFLLHGVHFGRTRQDLDQYRFRSAAARAVAAAVLGRGPGRESAALTSVAGAPRSTIASAEASAVGRTDLSARARAWSQASLRGPGKATSRAVRRRRGRRLRRCRGGRARRRREPGSRGAALAGVSDQRLRRPAPDDRLAGEGLADRRVGPLAFARLRRANDVVSIAAHGFERRQAGVERLIAARPVVAAGQALGFRRAQRAAAGQHPERQRGEGRWTRARRATTLLLVDARLGSGIEGAPNAVNATAAPARSDHAHGRDGAQSRPVDQAPESRPPPGQHRVRGGRCPCCRGGWETIPLELTNARADRASKASA